MHTKITYNKAVASSGALALVSVESYFWKIRLEITVGSFVWIFQAYVGENIFFEFDSKRLITFYNYTRLYLECCYFDFLGADFGFGGPISYIFGVGFTQKTV